MRAGRAGRARAGGRVESDAVSRQPANGSVGPRREEVSEAGNTAEVEVHVRRDAADSPSVVVFQLSRHNARWLIDSLDITE